MQYNIKYVEKALGQLVYHAGKRDDDYWHNKYGHTLKHTNGEPVSRRRSKYQQQYSISVMRKRAKGILLMAKKAQPI